MSNKKNVRETNHYMIFRIGADTDIKNGRIEMVEKTLKLMEFKEDYVACLALSDAIKYQNNISLSA
jgi:hypothetical protein